MAVHELKIQPQWFERVRVGEKRAEIRKHDRDYQAGDVLHLYAVDEYGRRRRHFVERDDRGRFRNEYVDDPPVVARVTHVLSAHLAEGVAAGYCLLSIELLDVTR